MKRNLFFIACFFTLILIACTRPAGSESHERTIWYVSITGSDSNRCTEPTFPCRTVSEAFARADADDQIIIASGTYNEVAESPCAVRPCSLAPDYYAFQLDYDLWIVGAGADATIIDLGDTYGGFRVSGDARLRLEGVTIQNARGNAPASCMYLDGTSTASLENVNMRHCVDEGIETNPDTHADLSNVTITDSTRPVDYYGLGVGVNNQGTMTILGGEISANAGAGIVSGGTLEVNGTVFQNNGLQGIWLGGGSATLTDLEITNNDLDRAYVPALDVTSGASVSGSHITIDGNVWGVRVLDSGTTLLLQDSRVSNSTRTGIEIHDGAMVTLDSVLVDNNGAANVGTSLAGGIDNRAGLVIRSSHITGNQNGGVISSAPGNLTIRETTIDANTGSLPALFNRGTADIRNSLIANNTFTSPISGSATAVENRGVMNIWNTTISGNQGTGVGAESGTLYLKYVTIAENSEVGLSAYHGGEGVGLILNTLIVKNGGRGNCVALGFGYPALPLSGINIETEPVVAPDACGFPEVYSDTEIQLDVLADNGGPTLTHALLPGSPARDAASGTCPVNDQRLAPRPVGLACDVGAFEAGASPLSLGGFDFPTPTPGEGTLKVMKDFPCYTGPGPAYNTLSTLKAGTQLQIVGYGFGGGWLVAFHPNLQGQHCWIDEDFVTTNVPVGDLRLISVPPKPTSTPSATPEKREPTPCATTTEDPKACD